MTPGNCSGLRDYQNAACCLKKLCCVIYYNFRHTFVPYRHCLHSMQCRVSVMVRCLSVCLSYSLAAAACGRFAALGQAGRRYQLTAARPLPWQYGAAAAVVRWQCHIVTIAEHRLVIAIYLCDIPAVTKR